MYLVGQMIERIDTDMQAPGKAHGSEGMGIEDGQGHHSLE
jgi:hypothetical protein